MDKKHIQLGMPIGTASNRLKKSIILMLLKNSNLNFCHQCGNEIESENELSVEHKEPWLDSDNPTDKFFDLDNIAFSHLKCNVAARRHKGVKHPSHRAYNEGCRCDDCKAIEAERRRKQRTKNN